jgi:hypothetical protein
MSDVATWPAVPAHVVVPVSERDELERRWRVTWCRRCGFMVVNDRHPENVTKRDCQVVKVGIR